MNFALGYGDWIRLLRANGFEVEDLVELQAPEGATTSYPFVTGRVGAPLAERRGLGRAQARLTVAAPDPRSVEADEPPGVVAVDLAKDVVRQAEPVDRPAALARRRLLVGVVGERLVERLEEAVVDARRWPGPGPCPPRTGCGPASAGRGSARRSGCRPSSPIRAAMSTCQFGYVASIRSTRVQVLRGASDMGADERRRRMAGDDGLEPVEELVERRGSPARPAGPRGRVGQKCQSGWAWSSSTRSLCSSSGSKKAIGSATWMVTGTPSSPADGPERVEARVVDRDETAVRPARVEAQRLPDLEAAGAGADAVAQARRLGLAESRRRRPSSRSRGRRTPRRARAAADCHRSISRRSASPHPPSRSTSASIPAASSVAASSLAVATGPVAAERRAEVVVGVDGGEARARDAVPGDAQPATAAGSRPGAGPPTSGLTPSGR